MMSRHFAMSLGLTGAIAKRLPHAKNQHSVPGSFSNQFVTYTHINRVLIVRILSSRAFHLSELVDNLVLWMTWPI